MKAFELHHPKSVSKATEILSSSGNKAQAMSGGQDLLGLMKDYIVTPDIVVNLKRIPYLSYIRFDKGKGLRIGALTTITEIEEHPDIRAHFPALAEAARSVASIQIRNVGTAGGNLCQRPRCWYFRNEHANCLKKGGSHCYAAADDAENKYHAIFGQGPCHIVHPSDLATALSCLGASVAIASPKQSKPRIIPLNEFYKMPEDGGIHHETILQPGEIVTEVIVPASAYAQRSIYIKFRERESFDWALSSVAMAVNTSGDTIKEAHIVLGGVAPIPWHAIAAEEAMRGQSIHSDAMADAAAKASVKDANPLAKNGYKIPLTETLVRRAVMALRQGQRTAFSDKEQTTWQV